MSADLLKQIDDLVASKTFNLDALDGIKQLKDSLGKTLAELEETKDKLTKARQTIVAQEEDNKRKDAKIEFLNTLVKANEETAKKGQEAIYDAAKHKAVAEAWQSAMAMVFKPNAVREAVQRNHTVVVPSGGGSGYTQSVQNQDFITREDA